LEKLFKCGSKIFSATKFIDFFVHDILDYTLLNEKEENFMANNTVFDIKTGVNEIKGILEDKVQMKAVNIDVNFNSFFNKYTVKTDLKRM